LLGRTLINYTNEILKPIVDIATSIYVAHLRTVNPRLQIPQDISEKIFYKKEWFKVQWTEGIFKINNRTSVEDIRLYISYIIDLAKIDPTIIQVINKYELLKSIESKISLDKNYLVEKNEYDAIMEQQRQLQALAQSQQLGGTV
jgi:hypothetical protein